MTKNHERFEICLFGQFSLRTSTGEDLTPRGKKTSALIALLAECDTGKRARSWLEQTLWSDRGSEQARGSLRQTLFELRRQLGEFSEILRSDRTSVWLDQEQVVVLPPKEGRIFLEGMEVQDPRFRDWLSRKRIGNQSSELKSVEDERIVRIQCGLPWTVEETDSVGERILNDEIGGIISGFIAHSARSILESDADLIVRASLEEVAEGIALSVQVIDARRDLLIHSDHSLAADVPSLLCNDTQLSMFCWKVADGALDRLAAIHQENNPAAMRALWSQSAINAVLTFDQDVMPNSLEILRKASSALQDGLFSALEAWSMMSLIMEDRLEESAETLAEIRKVLDKAEKTSLGDPMVIGIVANVRAILFEEYSEAFRLSNISLRAQPNNVFASQAMSLCRLQVGSKDIAYQLSRKNRKVASATKYGPMCNLHHALLCLRTSRPDEAAEASRTALSEVPSYRAPSRQLVALYAASGQVDAAVSQAEVLAKVEPGFTIDRLINDERYPANTLRTSGVLAEAKRKLEN